MENRNDFLNYMEEQIAALPCESVSELVKRAEGTDRLYLVFVDILKGFCQEGPLSSKRVAEMIQPVRQLAQALVDKGLSGENLVFLQDDHSSDAVEFSSFPPHCVKGTSEAETVEALKPFRNMSGVQVFRKNATNALFSRNEKGVRFFEFLENRFQEGPSTFVITGDCTDLCIYQNAMGIRLLANELNADVRVVVSAEHTRTYDTPVEVAKKLEIPAHDGDLMDLVFLYHMKLNGIEVVKTITEK